jgi:predicted nuclease of predicted toxin-antitoxin system
VVSQDTDFTNLLFHRQAATPSLILLRDLPEVTTAHIAELLLANLDQLVDALTEGAIVSVVEDRVRVRRLPLR